MNEYAFRHYNRLAFKTQRLVRDLHALRQHKHLAALYAEVCVNLERRISALTEARCAFGRWLRAHPECSEEATRAALAELKIPVTRAAAREAQRALRRGAAAGEHRSNSGDRS